MIDETQMLVKEQVYHRELDENRRMPVSVFLPQAYEPRYAYPLLVFLHGHGEQEAQWIEAVPKLSRRNYLCVGLRGPHAVTKQDGQTGYGWGRHRRCDAAIEDYVFKAIGDVMRNYHVHTERIFLAGNCEGAATAYQLGLSSPRTFAGVVALNGWLPDGPMPLRHERHASRPALFIGHGAVNAAVPPARAREAADLLTMSGFDVTTRYYPVGHRLHPMMLRDVDRWLMDVCLKEPLGWNC